MGNATARRCRGRRGAGEHSNYRATLTEAEAGGGLGRTVLLGTQEWDEMLEGGRDLGPRRPGGYDVANKGVLLTQRKIFNNGRFIAM
jgi:hypothetical protein